MGGEKTGEGGKKAACVISLKKHPLREKENRGRKSREKEGGDRISRPKGGG